MFKKLDGYKTYIGSAALFVLGGLLALGIIDQKQFEILIVVIGGWLGYSIRSAMKKLE